MKKKYCEIEKMGKDKEVLRMVLDSIPYVTIAKTLNLDKDTVRDYIANKLNKKVAIGMQKGRRKLTDDFMASIQYQQDKAQKLIEACDEWLRKPGRTGKYTLDPRADEINVVYKTTEIDTATGREKEVKKECSLQELIDGRQEIVSLKYKYSDPRALIVSALAEARKQTELIAKVTGELKEISQTADTYAVVAMVINAITSESGVSAAARRRIMDEIEAGMALIEQEVMAG